MLKFITKENKIDVLSSKGGITLGYIKDSIFFPNNNMMFKKEWLIEIAEYMRKHGEISILACLGGDCGVAEGKGAHGITAHYTIKDVEL